MHNGSPGAYRFLMLAFMHLVARPFARVFGGSEVRSLELPGVVKQPILDDGRTDARLHYYADANVGVPKSHTGITAMFGGVAFDDVSQRQQVKSTESHTSEVISAGTCVHKAIPHRGFIQESHFPQLSPTAVMLDSQTTIYVANNDAAAGRSLWLRRRVAVLHQAAGDGTAEFVKVPEEINCSDMHTKYLVFKRWARHRQVTNNLRDHYIAKYFGPVK